MFTVEDIDNTVARLQTHGAELVGEIVQYENLDEQKNLEEIISVSPCP
jgi:hypothetical protein